MAKLIGDKPNQVPTNADLGDLAYVDMDNIPSINVDGGTLVVDAATGRVGIGTSSPTAKLEVIETSSGRSWSPSSITELLVERSGTVGLTLSTDNAGEGRLNFGNESSETVGRIRYSNATDAMSFDTDGTERMRITSAGNVGIGTTSPTNLLDVNADSIRVRTAQTPASASAAGNQGEIAWDADYIYVCTATDTWKRVAIATW